MWGHGRSKMMMMRFRSLPRWQNNMTMTGLLLLLGLFSSQASAQREMVLEGFELPELDQQTGILKSKMLGDKATIRKGHPTKIDGLTIQFYDRLGADAMVITSPACTYDADEKKARSRERIHIEGRGFTIEGQGFHYAVPEERLQIHSNARVVLKRRSDESPLKIQETE